MFKKTFLSFLITLFFLNFLTLDSIFAQKAFTEYILPPIHNIIILYFLFPLELKEKKINETFEFNLPLRKVSIRIKEIRQMKTKEGIKKVYLLEGLPRKFKIWLEEDKRIPLRVEVPAYFGKVVINKI